MTISAREDNFHQHGSNNTRFGLTPGRSFPNTLLNAMAQKSSADKNYFATKVIKGHQRSLFLSHVLRHVITCVSRVAFK